MTLLRSKQKYNAAVVHRDGIQRDDILFIKHLSEESGITGAGTPIMNTLYCSSIGRLMASLPSGYCKHGLFSNLSYNVLMEGKGIPYIKTYFQSHSPSSEQFSSF